jgi:hypothetical protein
VESKERRVRIEKAWRYAAVSVLGVAGVVSTSFVGGARGVRAAAEAPFASCAAALLAREFGDPVRVYRLNTSTGAAVWDSNWTGSVPLDLSRADYDPDGTLYTILKTDPRQRSFRWAAVDLHWSTVTSVSALPADLQVIDFAFTPSVNASPRGYLLSGDPAVNAPLQLYAIQSAWPLVLAPVVTSFPANHNYSLGLGVAPNGDALYYTTTDLVYVAPAPSFDWQAHIFTKLLNVTRNAQVAGPAAGEPLRIFVQDRLRLHELDITTTAYTTTPVSGLNTSVGLVFRECPAGGVRLVPQSGLTTTEAGGTAQFTAVLTTRPQDDVTVRFKSTNPSEGKVRGRPLVFTPEDWYVPRTVTVAGIPDAVSDGSTTYWITAHPLESGDPAYDGREVGRIPVVNIDVDSRGPRAPVASRRP